ncbi:aldehyde dehydrogenase family protein [bacterium]|nr:aldehyde dehydrogenase family protein [bacterium]
MAKDFKLYINGEWIDNGDHDTVTDKYTGEGWATLPRAGEREADQALEAAAQARQPMREMTARLRGEILEQIVVQLKQRERELAETIAVEAGKSWKYALGEVKRAQETFTFAADVARTFGGETVPMDAAARGKDTLGFWIREPVGVVLAITPFNFPLNLVAHKVAPAIATGCPVVLKPAGTTPITALKLAEILDSTPLPKGAYNVVHGSGSKLGKALVPDRRVNKVSFTGSVEVGRWIKQNSDVVRVTLELGNNSAVVVDEDANLDDAIPQCVTGSYANSGQVCIGIQRIYVHGSHFEEFLERFVEQSKQQKIAHPLEEDGDVGPLISEGDVERVQQWVQEARDGGAKVLSGGEPVNERIYPPTVLTGTNADMKVWSDELFAPVVIVERVESFEEGLRLADTGDYGLQAGVFTPRIKEALQAIRGIDVGGIMINGIPTFRVDHMPYGGNKMSGIGREGVRFAAEEMTSPKMVVIKA